LQGRKVGVLIADGSDAGALASLRSAIEAAGGTCFVVAPKVGATKLSDGSTLKADGQLAGSPSQLFDAVAIVVSDAGCAALLKQGAAVQFAMDAYGHLKAIGAVAASKPLLVKAGVEPGPGVVSLADLPKAAARRYFEREPSVRELA